MKRCLLTFVIITSFFFETSQAQTNLKETFQKGVKYLRAKSFVKAEQQFNAVLKIAQRKPVIKMSYIYKGFALNGQGKYLDAISNFDKAIEIDPDDAASYTDRGKSYIYAKKLEQAKANFKKVLTIDSTGKQAEAAYFYLGWIYLKQFKNKEAIEYLDRLLALVPTDAEAYFNRGIAKGNLFDFKGAIKDYDKAIRYKPDYREAYANRGVAKINLIPTKDKLGKKIDCLPDPCADLLKAQKLGDQSVNDMIFLYCKKCK